MFWHGRSYGHKTIFFLLISFLKVWSFEWTVFTFQLANGMSIVAIAHSLIRSIYAVCLMNFLIVWWNTASYDVN